MQSDTMEQDNVNQLPQPPYDWKGLRRCNPPRDLEPLIELVLSTKPPSPSDCGYWLKLCQASGRIVGSIPSINQGSALPVDPGPDVDGMMDLDCRLRDVRTEMLKETPHERRQRAWPLFVDWLQDRVNRRL